MSVIFLLLFRITGFVVFIEFTSYKYGFNFINTDSWVQGLVYLYENFNLAIEIDQPPRTPSPHPGGNGHIEVISSRSERNHRGRNERINWEDIQNNHQFWEPGFRVTDIGPVNLDEQPADLLNKIMDLQIDDSLKFKHLLYYILIHYPNIEFSNIFPTFLRELVVNAWMTSREGRFQALFGDTAGSASELRLKILNRLLNNLVEIQKGELTQNEHDLTYYTINFLNKILSNRTNGV